ncbi:MAG TPA: glycosyltransferase family 9 protein [Opitutus sp.]|nr:glycosyltransferase family 9 protein [Opitutus sp.]
MDILIIKISSFGDIVHGLQVTASLRAQLREPCAITWLVTDRFAGLVAASGMADEVWAYSRRSGFFGGKPLRDRVRGRRFDAVLDLQGRFKTGFWTHQAEATRKIGRRDARELANVFYQETAPLPPGGRYGSHAIEILLEYLPLFGCEPKLAGPLKFPGSPRPKAVAPAVLAARPILIFPDSARPAKEWPGHRELTRRIANENPAIPIAWPGWAEMAAPEGIEHGNFHDLMKKVPLPELPGLVASARLVVANDSGPMHLAAAMGVPVIGIFGPSSSNRYRPWALTPGGARVIEAPGARLANLSVEAVHAEITACLRANAEMRLGS